MSPLPERGTRVEVVDTRGVGQNVFAASTNEEIAPTLLLPVAILVVMNAAGQIAVRQRSFTDLVAPGHVDVVSGVVPADVSPQELVVGHAKATLGLALSGEPLLMRRRVRVPPTGRRTYRWLFYGLSDGTPRAARAADTLWARWASRDQVRAWLGGGEYQLAPDLLFDIGTAMIHHESVQRRRVTPQ